MEYRRRGCKYLDLDDITSMLGLISTTTQPNVIKATLFLTW